MHQWLVTCFVVFCKSNGADGATQRSRGSEVTAPPYGWGQQAAAKQQSGVGCEHWAISRAVKKVSSLVRVVGQKGGGGPPSDLAKKRSVQVRVRIKACVVGVVKKLEVW